MERVLTIWQERGVFEADFVESCRKAMATSESATVIIVLVLVHRVCNLIWIYFENLSKENSTGCVFGHEMNSQLKA